MSGYQCDDCGEPCKFGPENMWGQLHCERCRLYRPEEYAPGVLEGFGSEVGDLIGAGDCGDVVAALTYVHDPPVTTFNMKRILKQLDQAAKVARKVGGQVRRLLGDPKPHTKETPS